MTTQTLKEIKEKARIGFRKIWSNINKENQHLTTEIIEDFIDSTIDSAISQAVKEREEENNLLKLARMELLELRGYLVKGSGIFEPDYEKLKKYWNSPKPQWEKDYQNLIKPK